MADLATHNARVDDTILVGAFRTARLRGCSVRSALEAHSWQCRANVQDSDGSQMVAYWKHRIDRIDAVLGEPDDAILRKRAVEALNREDR